MRRAALLLVTAVLTACSSPSLPPPLEGGDNPSQPASSAPGSPAAPSGGVPSAGAPSAPAGLSEPEAALLAGLREDAQVNCVPRRQDLPPKATDGIECAIGSELVERVGVYGFTTIADAQAAYVARMASYGVALRSGDCRAGTAGDRAWTPGDGPGGGGDLPYRIGCFVDENGTANVRLTCGDPEIGVVGPVRYIGVLGAARDLEALSEWAERYPEGVEIPVPSPPGICFNDGLPLPD